MATKAANGELKDRDGRGGKDERSRADEKIGSGPRGGKLIKQPIGTSDGDGGELEQRGATSEMGRKFWKQTGYKIPKSVHENHTGKK